MSYYYKMNYLILSTYILKEIDVSADIVLNRGVSEWWSFHDTNSLDVSGCGGWTGPMAIIVSEETPREY